MRQKREKKCVAILLAVSLMLLSLSPAVALGVTGAEVALDEATNETVAETERKEAGEREADVDSSEAKAEAEAEAERTAAETAEDETSEAELSEAGMDTAGTEWTETNADETNEEARDEAESSEAAVTLTISYLIVESLSLTTPDTQRIILALEEGEGLVLSLGLSSPSGDTEYWQGSDQGNGIYVFSRSFSEGEAGGSWTAESLLLSGEEESCFLLSDLGVTFSFAVDCEYEEELTLLYSDESEGDECSIVVVSLVGAGEEEIEEIAEALAYAENGEESGISLLALGDEEELAETVTSLTEEETTGDIIVAIDAGHDSKHTGASGYGLSEDVLTLKIATYCKEELETYAGVSVYMTRTTQDCPYPEAASSSEDIQLRVQEAVEAGASYYVSIHLNSAANSSAKGALVIIPSSNWRAELAEEGSELATAILKELVAAGVSLRTNYLYSQDATDGETYDDGSVADYYGVIRYAKRAGIVGIIVEHVFLSNSSDVSTFLTTEAGLQALGVADATGIATFLGLSKAELSELETPALSAVTAAASSIKVSWGSVSGASGYAVYRKEAGGSWKLIATTTETSYADETALTSGTSYVYTVRAYRGTLATANANKYASQYWSSYDSSGLSFTYLAAPTLGTVTAAASGLKVSWGSVSGASGYAIYRKVSGGSWAMLATTTETSYVDETAVGGTTYYYTVRAYQGELAEAMAAKYRATYWSGYVSSGVSTS